MSQEMNRCFGCGMEYEGVEHTCRPPITDAAAARGVLLVLAQSLREAMPALEAEVGRTTKSSVLRKDRETMVRVAKEILAQLVTDAAKLARQSGMRLVVVPGGYEGHPEGCSCEGCSMDRRTAVLATARGTARPELEAVKPVDGVLGHADDCVCEPCRALRRRAPKPSPCVKCDGDIGDCSICEHDGERANPT